MTTQKHLRELIARGIAKSGDDLTYDEVYNLAGHAEKIEASAGVYGINGALVRDCRDGELYAFVGRTSRLYVVA